MPQRESRGSDSKRYRSKHDREPSPKRTRRDGRSETETISRNATSDIKNHTNQDHRKHQRRLQDASRLEDSRALDSKVEARTISKDLDRNGLQSGRKHSSDRTEIPPRSQPYFQHDERGNAGQAGQISGRRATADRGWWMDSREQHRGPEGNKVATRHGTHAKDEKSRVRNDDNAADKNHAWRHDGYFKMVAEPPPPPPRKRPSFREKKLPERESENSAGVGTDAAAKSNQGSENRRDERGGWVPRHLDRVEKSFAGVDKAQPSWGWRGRREGGGGGGRVVERWKHDLFDEANRSPPNTKNEEDHIAKVEALLAK